MRAPILSCAADAFTRRCPVPADLDAVTTIGDEVAAPGVEAVWSRIVGLYRTGVHPAVQVCIRLDGDVVLHRSIGYANGVVPGRRLEGSPLQPLDLATPFNLFSAAKAVTSMVMHKLEEQGVVVLDDPVANYLPGFDRHGKAAITLRQVLTHRAGIPSLPLHAFDLDLLADPDRVRATVCDLEPRREPGGPPAYHAVTGGFVMDAVARQTTGRSLRDILATDVKAPLGLTWFDYGVGIDDVPRVAANVMTGFPLGPLLSPMMRRLLGRHWEEVVEMSNDPRFLSGVIPSANVVATAADTAVFYQCLLDGGEYEGRRVFAADTVARAVDVGDGAISIDRMIGMPFCYGGAGFMHGTTSLSLYGWNHPRAFGHVGMSNSFTWADPDRGLVVALLTTGKAILGTHLAALPQVIREIHRVFPTRT